LLACTQQEIQRAGLNGPFLVVSQPRILKALRKSIGTSFPSMLIPDGERAKTMTNVGRILERAAAMKMTRQSTLIALGGGVVGDVTGFAASLYMRGISVVQVPTTLLAQVDSSIGGKTGVNFLSVKNLVGTFHQPSLVLSDSSALQTLSDREFANGLYETLKYGIIADKGLFEFFVANLDRIKRREPDIIELMVARCAEIKAGIVSADEREGDLRRVLNLGHTVGHGLESAADFRRLKHGEAVGYGMIAAARIAASTGRMSQSDAERVESAVRAIGALPSLQGLKMNRIMKAVQQDKKVLNGSVHFILPLEIGRVEITRDVPISLVRETTSGLIHEGKTRK
jgi:3-dehydroquinate synthase